MTSEEERTYKSAMAMDSECFDISLCLLSLLRCPDKMLNLIIYFWIKITNAMVKMFRLDFKFNRICPDVLKLPMLCPKYSD